MVPGAQARGQGIVRLDSMQMSATFHLKADSLAVVDSLVDLPVRFDSLVADVSIFGPFSRLQMEGEAETFNASAYDAQMDQMQARFQIDVNGDSLEVRSQAEARHITYQGFHWDSLNVEMRYIPEILQLRAGLFLPDTFDLRFETSIGLDSILNVEVPALQANTLFADYYLKDTLRLKVDGTTRFSIENLQLLDQNNPDFLLQVEGLVSMTDTNDLKVELKDFGLNQLNEWLSAEDSLYGRLNSTFSLSGSPRNPELSGAIHLSEAGFGNYSLSALNGTIHFEDSKVTSEITIPELGETFKTTVEVPLSAYIDSMQMVYSQPDSFEASVVLENFDIRELGKQFVPRDSLKGRLNMNLNARGTLQNPQVFGTIRLDQASYQNKQVGLDYKNVLASVLFDGNRMKIDSVLIQQKKGFLTLTGELAFDTSLITGNIVASSLQADARNFFLSQNRNYEILIDANTFLKNSNGQPEFGGKIKVLRSDIFLPALMKESQPGPDADVPMLVQALQTPDTIQVSDTIEHHFVSPGEIQNIFLEKLRGKMNVEIPRNTWVRSDDMRLELNGDVDIVKNGPDFELFGSVGINRGYYLLYGKKLNVEESSITFEGGEEFDPVLNFKAEHIFRGSDRGKRYLELLMTGKLSEPTISFKLDGTEITENDGVSVLLFGTTADEIGFSEQEGMIGSISSQALASLITTQLSKTIGTQFNLDMIEITATDNWQSAAFVVGKYITNDIFVIYERGFGEVDGDEITPETITVEYELNDKLFLRLQSGSSITSGIDLILKFEEKQKKANLSRK
jgi:translocation and assembly module TamB